MLNQLSNNLQDYKTVICPNCQRNFGNRDKIRAKNRRKEPSKKQGRIRVYSDRVTINCPICAYVIPIYGTFSRIGTLAEIESLNAKVSDPIY